MEFATWNDTSYYFWKVSDELSLQYQEGSKRFESNSEDPRDTARSAQSVVLGHDAGDAHISTMQFSYPIETLQTVFLLVGLSNGYVWSVDSRTNSLFSQIKISDTQITNIEAKQRHIVVSKENDTTLSCWKIPEPSEMAKKKYNLFSGDEQSLLLDGDTK